MNRAFEKAPAMVTKTSHLSQSECFTKSIAIQVHLYYIDLLDEILSAVNSIPFAFDCYVSTDTKEKQAIINQRFQSDCYAQNTFVQVFPNRGRDIGPFFLQMESTYQNYDYLCHIHTKKSNTVEFGDDWRKYLIRNLLGSPEFVAELLVKMESSPKIGIAYPSPFPLLENIIRDKQEIEALQKLAERTPVVFPLNDMPVYSAGTMFWAKTKALHDLFALNLNESDFPFEEGQINLTIGHALEIALPCFTDHRGFSHELVQNAFCEKKAQSKKRLAVYLHFNNEDFSVAPEDMFTIKQLYKLGCDIVVISNSPLRDRAVRKLSSYTLRIIQRKNTGYDFGAWKDYLLDSSSEIWGEVDYEELILINNSCIGPIIPFDQMFSTMESRECDFWGQTKFPYWDDLGILDPSDDGSGHIPEHIQSYFLVFSRKVFESNIFRQLWIENATGNTYARAIITGELALTETLHKAGFSYDVYIPESASMLQWLNTLQPQNELGYEYALLGAPLLKKKNRELINSTRRALLLNVLSQLDVSPSIKNYFIEPTNRSGHFPGKRTLSAWKCNLIDRLAGY